MRRIFQIDGVDSGLLSIGESKSVNRVVLCIQSGDREAQVLLDEEAFRELCELRYQLDFVAEAGQSESQRLQVV